MNPIRIGLVGASRISANSMIAPARLVGLDLEAVAARDQQRAEAYAAKNGINRVVGSYQQLIDDPGIDAVYNSLPNGLHAPWNLAAIAAGKHVLSEKPFAANAPEALQVHEAGRAAGLVVADGFHYRYHPVTLRTLELIAAGVVGTIERVTVELTIPAPSPADPRWQLDLAGGAMMDLGVYALHACRILAPFAGGEPTVVSARAVARAGLPGVDEEMTAELAFPDGATASLVCRMQGTDPTQYFTETITGTAGSISLPNFVLPHLDDRVIIRTSSGEEVEHLGTRPSYAYQLDAFLDAVQRGVAMPTDSMDAVATMKLVDACYVASGLAVRNSPQLT